MGKDSGIQARFRVELSLGAKNEGGSNVGKKAAVERRLAFKLGKRGKDGC